MLKLHRSNKALKRKKGQSTVEFILLATAVISAMIFLLGDSGPFKKSLNETLNATANDMQSMADKLNNSH